MSQPPAPNPDVTWHAGAASRAQRERLLGQRGCVVWLTGLSGSGKSTIAVALEAALLERGRLCYRLDGDNLRHGLNTDLGFNPADRAENVRRVREVAALLADAGLIVLASLISPYRGDRQAARERIGAVRFVEVYCDAPLETCESRDPKGLYAKARRGEIAEFTGLTAPYDPPVNPNVRVATAQEALEACVAKIMAHLVERGVLTAP